MSKQKTISTPDSYYVPFSPWEIKNAQKKQNRYEKESIGKRAYFNTLATYAAKTFFNYRDVDDELLNISIDNLDLVFLDTAKLEIEGKGIVECRYILPGDTSCHIPMETWDNRIGYVAIEINEEEGIANLVGFIESVDREDVPLCDFQPLSNLLEKLQSILYPEWILESLEKMEKFLNSFSIFDFDKNNSSQKLKKIFEDYQQNKLIYNLQKDIEEILKALLSDFNFNSSRLGSNEMGSLDNSDERKENELQNSLDTLVNDITDLIVDLEEN